MSRWDEVSVLDYVLSAVGRLLPPFIGQGEAVTSMPRSKMCSGCVLASRALGGTGVLANPCARAGLWRIPTSACVSASWRLLRLSKNSFEAKKHKKQARDLIRPAAARGTRAARYSPRPSLLSPRSARSIVVGVSPDPTLPHIYEFGVPVHKINPISKLAQHQSIRAQGGLEARSPYSSSRSTEGDVQEGVVCRQQLSLHQAGVKALW
jgi:hypothetical protein